MRQRLAPSALTHIRELSDVLSHARSLAEASDAAVDHLMRAVPVERAGIVLLDRTGAVCNAAWRGLSARYRATVESCVSWWRHTLTPGPLLAEDVEQTPALAGQRAMLRSERIRALALIPLQHHGELLGALMLYHRTRHAFVAEEVELARIIAGQAAWAVERMRALDAEHQARQRAESSAERMACLQRVAAALSGAITSTQIADVVLDHGLEAMGAQAGMLFVLGPDRRALELLRVHGYPAGLGHELARIPVHAPVPMAEACRRGAPVWIHNAAALHARYPHLPGPLRELGSAALACVPLPADRGPVGVVVFGFPGHRAFPADERAFIIALADHAARAVERAELFATVARAVQAREQILGVVAHDLRTPLTVISMTASEMLEPDTTADQRCDHVARILRNTRRMERLIRDLLDFSQIEAGQLAVETAPYRIDDIARQAMEAAQAAAPTHCLALDLPARVAAMSVLCDRERTLQVLGNLIGNAVKFTPEGGAIRMRVAEQQGWIVLSVADTGRGIAADALPHLFERYWQVERGHEPAERKGVGLGLFIVKALVEAQGGRIWVQSQPARGSTFSFRLPVARAQPRRSRILVIDGEPESRRDLCDLLERHGYAVTAVARGREARAYLDAHPPPGLILLDLTMPVAEGWDLLTHLRTDPVLASVPAIILSCASKSRVAPALFGAAGHLEKPIDTGRLIEVVRALCGP